MREVGKIRFLPTHLHFFDIASDTSFAKMYKGQHPWVCQRWRQHIKYLLGWGHSSLSVRLPPVTICGYCPVLICCQPANSLLYLRLIQLYFITFQRKGFDHSLDTEEEKAAVSGSPLPHWLHNIPLTHGISSLVSRQGDLLRSFPDPQPSSRAWHTGVFPEVGKCWGSRETHQEPAALAVDTDEAWALPEQP